jgi:hypothetical protein
MQNTIVSFGPQFFIRMHNLEVARICPIPHAGDGNYRSGHTVNQEDIYDLLIGWRRWCPKLQEIQLTDDCTWRRASDADKWTKRPLGVESRAATISQMTDFPDSWA